MRNSEIRKGRKWLLFIGLKRQREELMLPYPIFWNLPAGVRSVRRVDREAGSMNEGVGWQQALPWAL